MDDNIDLVLRPRYFDEYIGQKEVIENLKIFISAARNRNEVLDHILLYGPPGTGKTTIAHIISNEMNEDIIVTNGGNLEKQKDLASVLATINAGSFLFIDECHRIPKHIEEMLYSVMEDYKLDIIIKKGEISKTISIDIEPFTLICATTQLGLLSKPFKDRFLIECKMKFYDTKDIMNIINRTAKVFENVITNDACKEIALRSRNIPRIANKHFKRIRDFAQILNNGIIDIEICNNAFKRLNINKNGLDHTDIKILSNIINKYDCGPVGIEALCSSIMEDKVNVVEVNEPFLLHNGFLKRTPRGRIATKKAINYLKYEYK